MGLVVTFGALFACSKDDGGLSQDEINDEFVVESSSEAVIDYNKVAIIGERFPNPFAIDNMRQAYENNSEATKAEVSPSDLQPNLKYIRFIPGNLDELNSILLRDDIELDSYPMDYEISDGRIELDSRFLVDSIANRWAVIPIGFDLSDIRCPHELVYEMFDPETAETKAGIPFSSDFADALEAEAYRICGLDLEPVSPLTRASKADACGSVQFRDSSKSSYVGCEGMKIKAVRLLHSSWGTCDSSGDFDCNDSFRYKFSYIIHFDLTDFEIRHNSSTSDVEYKFSGYHGPLNVSFGSNSYEAFFATIFRAAHHYYYGSDIGGLWRPPLKKEKNAKLAFQAYSSISVTASGGTVISGFFNRHNRWILSTRPIVSIYRGYRNNNGIEYTYISKDIFATTSHELTHAAHWKMGKAVYGDADNIVKESLARGCEWYLTVMEYGSFSPDYFRMSYTGLIEDLVDGYGWTTSFYYAAFNDEGEIDSLTTHYKDYYDYVTGYSVSEIEAAALGCKTWAEWENRIINKYPNKEDKDHVSDAFDFWNSGN